MARADQYTDTARREVRYSDFLMNFDRNPITKALAEITDEVDVKQALRNMITTENGEWAFEPSLGSRVGRLLFEPADSVVQSLIVTTISEAIQRNEPRVILGSVVARPMADESSYSVTISFGLRTVANSLTTLQLILKRAR